MDTKGKTDAQSTGNEWFQLIVFHCGFVDIYSTLGVGEMNLVVLQSVCN